MWSIQIVGRHVTRHFADGATDNILKSAFYRDFTSG